MPRISALLSGSLLALALGIRAGGRPVLAGDDASAAHASAVYVRDVEAACDGIERACALLLERKGVDWKKVRRPFLKEARRIQDEAQLLALLVRLVACLRDGHAAVRRTDLTKDVPYPGDGVAHAGPGVARAGPGMAWCRVGRKLHVKRSWSGAEAAGIAPGMEIVTVEGVPAARWFVQRVATLREHLGFSSEQHAEAFGFHEGLAEPQGTRMDYVLRDATGRRHARTVACEAKDAVASGPAVPPEGLQGDRDVRYGRTAGGFGYIHYRRCRSDVPYRTDDALKAIGNVPGLILDFRANGGGGFHHEEFVGRFIPPGKELRFAQRYGSRGEASYGGPIVVIVDGLTRGAGETASGMLKEDGRAYAIGPSPSAGMASTRTTLDLPSAKFQLYVSVRSSMARFNGGRGIEGIGIVPHEVLAYDPADLAAGRDTLIARAEALLADHARKGFPGKVVPYDPARFGWEPPLTGR